MVLNETDADRLELLDRIEQRIGLDVNQHEIEWITLPDGHEGLLVDGGGIDGGSGLCFANEGDDLHAVGSLDPIVPGRIGCIVIKPDGSRSIAQAVPDPLAQQ